VHRIAALPRRNWRDLEKETVIPLSECLRAARGGQTLRALQAVGLREALELGGAFIMGRVGVGKTLISLLAGEFMDEPRVLILVPGGVKAKTEDEFDEYRKDWNGISGERYKLFGYSDISRFPKEGYSIDRLWGGLGPTLIICDEADKLRRIDVTRGASGLALQVQDFLASHTSCKLIALTGTPDKSSILDYAHILQWCLRDGSPLPTNFEDLADWSEVIDKGDMRCARKVCNQLGIPHTEDLDYIREAYQERLRVTPGVIISDDQFEGPLSFKCTLLEAPPIMLPHFHQLRKLWQRPDGWDLSPDAPDEEEERRPDRVTGGGIWSCERQMALGFCYIADPVPPEPWMEARREAFKVVRTLLRNREYYTMFQVWQAFHKNELRPIHMKKLATWEGIRTTFEPGSRPLWISDHALRFCESWGRQAPGIIWVDQIAFGVELEKRTGFRYFQGGGKDRHGKMIEKAKASETIIASRGANSTGRNLQKWHRNLITAMPANNRDFEQLVGRTHRDGQLDAVTVEILFGCKAHFESTRNVLDDARRQDQTLLRQKATNFVWQHIREYPKGIQFNDHDH
jgi:hypothetical protein